MQVRFTEIRTAAHGPGKRRVGQVLTVEIAAVLVGEREVDGFLEQRPVLQTDPRGCVQAVGGWCEHHQQRQHQGEQQLSHQWGGRGLHSAVTTALANRSPSR